MALIKALAFLKKHPSVAPLFLFVGVASTGGLVFGIRQACKNPDVAWVRRPDGQWPNEDYAAKQHKLFSPKMDYSKIVSQAPKYQD